MQADISYSLADNDRRYIPAHFRPRIGDGGGFFALDDIPHDCVRHVIFADDGQSDIFICRIVDCVFVLERRIISCEITRSHQIRFALCQFAGFRALQNFVERGNRNVNREVGVSVADGRIERGVRTDGYLKIIQAADVRGERAALKVNRLEVCVACAESRAQCAAAAEGNFFQRAHAADVHAERCAADVNLLDGSQLAILPRNVGEFARAADREHSVNKFPCAAVTRAEISAANRREFCCVEGMIVFDCVCRRLAVSRENVAFLRRDCKRRALRVVINAIKSNLFDSIGGRGSEIGVADVERVVLGEVFAAEPRAALIIKIFYRAVAAELCVQVYGGGHVRQEFVVAVECAVEAVQLIAVVELDIIRQLERQIFAGFARADVFGKPREACHGRNFVVAVAFRVHFEGAVIDWVRGEEVVVGSLQFNFFRDVVCHGDGVACSLGGELAVVALEVVTFRRLHSDACAGHAVICNCAVLRGGDFPRIVPFDGHAFGHNDQAILQRVEFVGIKACVGGVGGTVALFHKSEIPVAEILAEDNLITFALFNFD